MNNYPALCTGCEFYVYEHENSPPCPNCFPGLERPEEGMVDKIDRILDEIVEEREAGTYVPVAVAKLSNEEKAALQGIMDDFFSFQAAACTTQPDCTCGRH